MGGGIFFRTVQYLKPVQVLYQVKNRIVKAKPLSRKKDAQQFHPTILRLISLPVTKSLVTGGSIFNFLNLPKQFKQNIEWNFSAYGKLWNYNLQYFDYINQEDLPEELRVTWLRDLYHSLDSGNVKLEPYPVSLRVMNVIRFFSDDEARLMSCNDVLAHLHAELTYLHSNYEFHLLGNHLLENAFAMLMGGCFFNNQVWRTKASEILTEQLEEQILEDGAHFELSPMYHQIILFRILEAYSYLPPEDDIAEILERKAGLMQGWLDQMTFSNNDIPRFNDSTSGIAFSTEQLKQMAGSLGLETVKTTLKDSGYRKIKNNIFHLVLDAHGISPAYQPGHSHSDHLSFVLYIRDQPFVIDPGISTYTISPRREWERSSQAHNTVTVNDQNQSEVWSGFRVGRRAKVDILKESNDMVAANVKYRGINHARYFKLADHSIIIEDSLNLERDEAIARFYFHPSINISSMSDETLTFDSGIQMKFEGANWITIEEYDYCEGFNNLVKAKVLKACFHVRCKTIILVD